MSKTIGIVGSRRRDTREDFDKCLQAYEEIAEPGDWIVSGGCPKGGDRFAEIIALMETGLTHFGELGLWELNAKERKRAIKSHKPRLIIHEADWDAHGNTAGFLRNTPIADDSDVLIAVVALDRRGGTEDTVRKAHRRGKPIVLVH